MFYGSPKRQRAILCSINETQLAHFYPASSDCFITGGITFTWRNKISRWLIALRFRCVARNLSLFDVYPPLNPSLFNSSRASHTSGGYIARGVAFLRFLIIDIRYARDVCCQASQVISINSFNTLKGNGNIHDR